VRIVHAVHTMNLGSADRYVPAWNTDVETDM